MAASRTAGAIGPVAERQKADVAPWMFTSFECSCAWWWPRSWPCAPGRVEPEPGAQVGRLSGRVEGGQTEYVARRCLLRTLEARVRVQRREPLPEVGEIAARGGVPREVAFREDQQARDGDLAPGFLETVDRLAPFTASTSVTTPLIAKRSSMRRVDMKLRRI